MRRQFAESRHFSKLSQSSLSHAADLAALPIALLLSLQLWLVEAGLARAHRGAGLGHCLRLAARPTARWYREFVLGLGVTMFVTDAMKLLVSEPRPHFLDTCRPDAARNCSSATQWIDDFACTNQRDSPWAVRDSMRSFPSGHTSISVFTALFLMVSAPKNRKIKICIYIFFNFP